RHVQREGRLGTATTSNEELVAEGPGHEDEDEQDGHHRATALPRRGGKAKAAPLLRGDRLTPGISWCGRLPEAGLLAGAPLKAEAGVPGAARRWRRCRNRRSGHHAAEACVGGRDQRGEVRRCRRRGGESAFPGRGRFLLLASEAD